MNSLKRFDRLFPESRLKEKIKHFYYSQTFKAFQIELSRLSIVESGLDGKDKIPYVILSDGVILFGNYPTTFQRSIYTELCHSLPSTISADTIGVAIGVAIDVVTRYLYPHAMPNLTMPYSRRIRRKSFHLQHAETIEDLPQLSQEEREILKRTFSPIPGETFLDLGAYIGYGTVRLGRALGQQSKVISVEADNENLQLLKRNVECNKLTNVIVVPKAIWDREDVLPFYKSERQANSLIDGIIKSRTTVSVEATTVDKIAHDLNIGEVNIVSVTLNGAEVEAIRGMISTITGSSHIRLSLAGWYMRDSHKICDIVRPILLEYGLRIAVGREGGVLAWK